MLRGVVQLVNIVTRVTVLHTIGWPKRNERLPDMTPNRILLDVNVSPKEKNVKKRYNKHLNLKLDCIEWTNWTTPLSMYSVLKSRFIDDWSVENM
jgi:hypothetical protein